METYELLPTPNTQDAMIPSSEKAIMHDKKKGYLREKILSLQEVSPASLSPKLDEERERQMTATSGRKCYELYESFIRGGSSVKTLAAWLLGAKVWFSNKCILTWKVKVTKSNRLLFQLSPSMRRTGETGSGLLLTPSVITIERRSKESFRKRQENRIKTGHKSVPPGNLAEQIRFGKTSDMRTTEYWKQMFKETLPTPNARDTRGKSIKRDRVPDIIEGHNLPNGQNTGLKLQPAFVEWMMGYPEGWTEIPDSKLLEMRLSRKLQKK